MTCETCSYSIQHRDALRCHYGPPGENGWPQTHLKMWCGKYESKDALKETLKTLDKRIKEQEAKEDYLNREIIKLEERQGTIEDLQNEIRQLAEYLKDRNCYPDIGHPVWYILDQHLT